jgi:large subunit ribosomal protein L23Ae
MGSKWILVFDVLVHEKRTNVWALCRALKKKKKKKKAMSETEEKKVRLSRREQVRKQRGATIKAREAAKKQGKGVVSKRAKWRKSTTFKRPKTKVLERTPKFTRRSVPRESKMDPHRIIRYPLTTETAMKKIEENNTLVFIVDIRANKFQIKAAVEKLYDIKPERVNTLIRPDGLKKAYIRLGKSYDALDCANKLGII